MDSYEVNKDTVALVPKNKKQTTVYEVDKTMVVNKPALKIMEESCEYFGSSLEGRQSGTTKIAGFTHKVPVIVEETFDLIFFPTKSPRNQDCSWINYAHTYKPAKFKDKTILELRNGKKLLLDVSKSTLDSQLLRSSILQVSLDDRKIKKNDKKATKR